MIDDWWAGAKRRTRAELIDSAVPNVARAADYIEGGRDNFASDRKAAQAMMAVAPVVGVIVPALRAFHQRVIRYLVTEGGVRQFLDVGASLAKSNRTHELAQAVNPSCRIVYAIGDPMVLAHARALTTSAPSGAVDVVEAHIRDAATIVAGAAATLDVGKPVAIILLSTSVLSPIADTAAAAAAVSALAAAVPSGSYVALYHQASDLDPRLRSGVSRWNQLSQQPIALRSRAEVASLVAGLEPVSPGLVTIDEWHPAPGDPRARGPVPVYGVVARKP